VVWPGAVGGAERLLNRQGLERAIVGVVLALKSQNLLQMVAVIVLRLGVPPALAGAGVRRQRWPAAVWEAATSSTPEHAQGRG
jgi:hypothetical protein